MKEQADSNFFRTLALIRKNVLTSTMPMLLWLEVVAAGATATLPFVGGEWRMPVFMFLCTHQASAPPHLMHNHSKNSLLLLLLLHPLSNSS